MTARGIAHVHSTFSYDGCHALADLAAFAKAERLDFVLMSEHNRTLTEESMQAFVAACDELSAQTGVLLVPGIECEATPDYVHVLCYGVRTLVTTRDARGIVRAARAAGGFVTLAHPLYRGALGHLDRALLDELHGFEIWNGKADGAQYPSDEAIRRLAELRRTGATLAPMAGCDLHRLEAYPGITLEVACGPELTAASIFAALARRAYRLRGRGWGFAAADPLREPPRSPRRVAAAVALGLRRRAKRMNAWLKRRGVATPAPLAHAARRILK